MLYHLLLQTVNRQLSAASHGQPHLLLYEEDMEKAVNDLSMAAIKGSLYIIADEVVLSHDFQTFCDKIVTRVPLLQLWAASCFNGDSPTGWHVQYLTRPLRSPPSVVREVQQDAEITERRDVLAYSDRGVDDHNDGPPVRRLYHLNQGHSADRAQDCVTCAREIASFLHSLRVTVSSTTSSKIFHTTTGSSSTAPPFLQWRDVFVLCWYDCINDQSGVVTGLREAGIPVRVMEDSDIEDVATARSDVVWAVRGERVRGLERKVVVCLEPDDYPARLHCMSRCTSQLVIVSP